MGSERTGSRTRNCNLEGCCDFQFHHTLNKTTLLRSLQTDRSDPTELRMQKNNLTSTLPYSLTYSAPHSKKAKDVLREVLFRPVEIGDVLVAIGVSALP